MINATKNESGNVEKRAMTYQDALKLAWEVLEEKRKRPKLMITKTVLTIN